MNQFNPFVESLKRLYKRKEISAEQINSMKNLNAAEKQYILLEDD